MVADAPARLAALLAAHGGDPSALLRVRAVGDRLAARAARAGEAGAEAALAWRVAVVRAVMSAPPDPDAVREAYGELVDRYREDPARLARLRPLGVEIREREASGALPRALVARGARRARRP